MLTIFVLVMCLSVLLRLVACDTCRVEHRCNRGWKTVLQQRHRQDYQLGPSLHADRLKRDKCTRCGKKNNSELVFVPVWPSVYCRNKTYMVHAFAVSSQDTRPYSLSATKQSYPGVFCQDPGVCVLYQVCEVLYTVVHNNEKMLPRRPALTPRSHFPSPPPLPYIVMTFYSRVRCRETEKP